MRLLTVVARPMLATIFVVGGIDAARSPGHRVQAAEKLGLPQPEVAVRANGALMVTAGAALAVGYRPRLAALALLGSLGPTTYAGHAFWSVDDPAGRRAQLTQFCKNVGLAGGLLALVGTPSRRHEKRVARRAARRAARRTRKEQDDRAR